MSIVKVWSQFGKIRKLRLHDMSKDVSEAAIDLFLRYFDTEEPSNKAAIVTGSHIDKARWSEPFKLYEDYRKSRSDPNFSCLICCPDDNGEVTDANGITTTSRTGKNKVSGIDKECDKPKKKESKKICAMCKKLYRSYHYIPVEQNNLSSLYNDRRFLVVPDFRGVTKRRHLCEEQGYGTETQIAAARDGWKTVTKVPYKELSKRHGVVVTCLNFDEDP